MFITELLVASGAFHLGVATFRRQQKHKRLAGFLQEPGKPRRVWADDLPGYDAVADVIDRIKEQTGLSLSGDLRRRQLQVITASKDEKPLTQAEKQTNRNLALSVASLSAAALGSTVLPSLAVVSAAGLIYVSLPFVRDAYKAIFEERRARIAIIDATLAVWCIGTGYYLPWALICSLIYGGQKLLNATEDRSRQSLINVFGLQSTHVWVKKDGLEIETSLESVQRGDIVVFNAGETIAVDGTIVNGIASIDQCVLTGESQPAEKEIGDPVYASNVVLAGRIDIEVEKTGKQTSVAQIGDILNRTADFKLTMQSRGEKISDMSTLPVLGLCAIALPTIGPIGAMAIMNSCFGFYMRVLAPIGMLNFLNLASQQGMLIKDGRVLDLLGQVDTVVFDKTGTLTQEQPHIGRIHLYGAYTEDSILRYAAAAERKQTHPIARAILQAARHRGLTLPDIEDAEYRVGYGLTVTIGAQRLDVGSIRFMELQGIALPPEVLAAQDQCHEAGTSLVLIAIDNRVEGGLEMHATIRPEAKKIITRLRRKYGMSMYIISGDHEAPTRRLADELGIDHYFAETTPENKAYLIEKLQKDGASVCYVGDGINDSIALKKAQVSISLRGAATAATDTAQVILMDATLNQLVHLFDLAHRFDANLKKTLTATMVPSMLTVGGAFFLHFGLIHSVILNELGFSAGFMNTVMPLIKNENNKAITTFSRVDGNSALPEAHQPDALSAAGDGVRES